MPSKPMEELTCEIEGCTHPKYKVLKRHMSFYHPTSTPPLESGGSVLDQSPTPPGSKPLTFQDVDKKMADKKKQLQMGIKPPEAKSGKKGKPGAFLGIGRFFITIADWLNKTICKDPKIEMNEKIAKDLELQFNDAFGIYISPMIAFAGSMFFIFGLPILLNLFGEQIIVKLITKFKDGITDKLDGWGEDSD